VEVILFRNRLRHTLHTRLRQRVINLPRIPIDTRRTRYIDNIPRLAVLDAEIRRRSPHNLERRGRVQVHNGVPLLVRHLVDDAVPCIARVVDDDVYLAVAEVGGFLDERLDVRVVEHVARDGEGRAPGGGDGGDDGLGFFWGMLGWVGCGMGE
jgi:hypothetical protein